MTAACGSRLPGLPRWPFVPLLHLLMPQNPLKVGKVVFIKYFAWLLIVPFTLHLNFHLVTHSCVSARIFFSFLTSSLGPVSFPFIASTFFPHVKALPSHPDPFPYAAPHPPKKQLLSIRPDYPEDQTRTDRVTGKHRLHFIYCAACCLAPAG